jgi:hypothetical protein
MKNIQFTKHNVNEMVVILTDWHGNEVLSSVLYRIYDNNTIIKKGRLVH